MAYKDAEARREYQREYNKGWYRRHKERLLEKSKQHNKELRQWINQYKSKLCSVLYGEKHPPCLQIYHRDERTKLCCERGHGSEKEYIFEIE